MIKGCPKIFLHSDEKQQREEKEKKYQEVDD